MKNENRSKAIRFYLTAFFFASIVLATLAHAGVNNWSVRPNPSTNAQINGVAFGNGIYVTAGEDQTILSSLDALTWQMEVSASNYDLLDVVYGNNTYVAVGRNLMTSTDGQTWDELVFDPSCYFRSVAYGNNIFVGVGSYGYTASSLDAATWTYNTALANAPTLHSVTYGNGIFVAVGTAGGSSVIYSSLDGITWTPETIYAGPPHYPPY